MDLLQARDGPADAELSTGVRIAGLVECPCAAVVDVSTARTEAPPGRCAARPLRRARRRPGGRRVRLAPGGDPRHRLLLLALRSQDARRGPSRAPGPLPPR